MGIPLFENEAATFLNQVYRRADALGRRPMRSFPAPEGAVEDRGINPIAGA
jgi:hypothetical protein